MTQHLLISEESNRSSQNLVLFQPDHEYFSIGIIHQVAAKAGLLYYTEEVRRLIIEKLVETHRNYNLEICDTFEMIRERALNIPHTTKELLELGKFLK